MSRMFHVTTPFLPPRRWFARALAPAAAALLVACGGGGGDGTSPADQVAGPPTTAATLVGSSTDASQSARAAVASADAAAARARSLSGLSALLGQPVGSARVRPAASNPREQIQAVTTSSCVDFFETLSCSGSIVLDTNVAETATTVGPNDYADVRFQAVSGPLLGNQVSLNGRLRVDFLSVLNLNATTFTGMDLLLTLDGFSGTVNGSAFGPLSDVGRLQIDSNGASTVTAGGARYQGLSGVTTSGANSYRIGSGTVRTGHWTDSNTYVDLALAGWQVSDGRPVPGSRATLTAAQGSIDVTVASSSSQSVSFTVSITVNGVATHYLVTATYPVGGGAPTYNAVPA
jgi:hypothetical protein